MPPKKTRQLRTNHATTCVILRDNKTNSHHVFGRNQLSFAKKDNLKIGTSAKFEGKNDEDHAVEGVVVMAGSREQCQASLSLIENANKQSDGNKKRIESTESDSSKELIIDENSGRYEDDASPSDLPEDDEEKVMDPTVSNHPSNEIISLGHITTSSITVTSNQTSVCLPSSSSATATAVLQERSRNSDVVNKRKEAPDRFDSTIKKKPKSKISVADYEKLKHENKQLRKEVEMYKEFWMPQPKNEAAKYFIDVGKILSGASGDPDGEDDPGTKMETIMEVLHLTEKELTSCQHETDITKTCRQIVKYIYRDPRDRAKMLVSSMDPLVLKSIQDYARLVHPVQSRISNSILNNAIGNVFATDKRKYGGHEIENDSSDETEVITAKADD